MARKNSRLIDNKVKKLSKEDFNKRYEVDEQIKSEMPLSERAPAILDDDAKEIYKETRKMALELGIVFTKIDLANFIMYCDTYAEVRSLMNERNDLKELLNKGFDKDVDNALDKKRKALDIAEKRLSRLCSELGLSYDQRTKSLMLEKEMNNAKDKKTIY